ncbi:MAG: hypothetical protein ACLP3C_09680 [Mycobacterium sp.]|uniref:hypothetical protein n=1 Tax=Mycobacterium sp. TaxID=1785 RepID=UPI003F9589DD
MGSKKSGKKVQYAATCAFCGKRPPEVRLSYEHVFKESLKDLATPGSWLMGDHSYRDPETGETRFEFREDRNKNGYQATVRICVGCNTDILNNLIEEPFEDDFRDMREGRPVALDSDAVTRMATWAAKTAMTNELLDKDRGDPSIPPWQYRWLRDNVCPPPTMLMYFGKAENTPNGYRHHRRFRVDPEIPETAGHYTSFVIGHFWVIVAGFAHVDGLNLFGDSINEFYGQRHLRSLARFWPPDVADGNVSAVAPQTFPPGPEASLEMCKAIRFGPKKLSVIVNGVKHDIRCEVPPLPPDGPLHVKVNGQRKTVHVKQGRPPGAPPGPPDSRDLMVFINEGNPVPRNANDPHGQDT